MYLKTIDAVREWMLFRPMVPGSLDILFSGSISVSDDPKYDPNFSADVDHLTCFIGGMVGMGAKIFGLDGDLEIAQKLADGCVWAYEATVSGIMPEGATVMACESTERCLWNETAYWEYLDPAGAQRDQNLKDYLVAKADRELEKEASRVAAQNMVEDQRANAQKALDPAAPGDADGVPDHGPEFDTTDPSRGSGSLRKDGPVSLQKRQRQSSAKEEVPSPNTPSLMDNITTADLHASALQGQTGDLKGVQSPAELMLKTPAERLYEEKSQLTEAELNNIAGSGRQSEMPLTDTVLPADQLLPDPLQPLSHKEYVEARIKQEGLPSGFVNIKSKKYILR